MFDRTRAELEAASPQGMTRRLLEEGVAELTRVESLVAERRMAFMAAIDGLDDGGLDGRDVLRFTAKVSRRTAAAAARTARTLPHMPRTRRRLADGEITHEHAVAAADAADRVDDPEAADLELSATAGDMPADLFATRAREWADRHEPRDKAESRHSRQRRLRAVHTGRNHEGMITLHGAFDPETGAELVARLDEETDRLWRLDGGRDGTPDAVRTPEQRRSDALTNLTCGQTGHDGDTPSARIASHPGTHPKHQALVLIDLDRATGDDPSRRGEIIGGGPLPDVVLQRLLCDAAIAPLIVDRAGAPLWLGRKVRTATPDQWTALIARDGGCVHCGAPPSHCEAHHLDHPWPVRGTTDIDRMVLLCTRAHHDLHDHDLELVRSNGIWTLRPRDGPARSAAA